MTQRVSQPPARRLPTTFLLLLPALLFLVFLGVACLFLLRFSLNTWTPDGGMKTGWTPAQYLALLRDPFLLRVLGETFLISLLVTVSALILGYPVAYYLTYHARRPNVVVFLLILPMLMDVVVRSYGWVVLLQSHGMINTVLVTLGLFKKPIQLIYTRGSVAAELLQEVLPLMILTLGGALAKIPATLKEAATGMGASRWRAFWLVTLPLSLPGLMAGSILVFALGVSAFAAPFILGGGKVPMISVTVRQQMSILLNWPGGSSEAIFLVVIVVILLYLYNRALRAGTSSLR